jgi:hypothetical protein
MKTKEEYDEYAKESWRIAREWERQGKADRAAEARARAIEWEKYRDSWWHRIFGCDAVC